MSLTGGPVIKVQLHVACYVDELIRENRRSVEKTNFLVQKVVSVDISSHVFDHAIARKHLMDYEFTIHNISGFLYTNETNNVNYTFHDGVDFSTNITSAVHHSLHLKLPKTTADGSLTHSSRLAATLCFVT